MTKIDWSVYPKDKIKIYISNKGITEINWDNCPSTIKIVCLSHNKITKMNWLGCPISIEKIYLNNNQITEMNWEKAPSLTNLTFIDLMCNKITEINWKEVPPNLKYIDLMINKITKLNWNGVPRFLEFIYLPSSVNLCSINWRDCRNDEICIIYPANLLVDYQNYKESKDFIPYLPDTSPKKELHYELESIWWSAPNGIRYIEDIQELKQEGFFSS